MKDVVINSLGYFAALGAVVAYNVYMLTPDTVFACQFIGLLGVIATLTFVYLRIKKHVIHVKIPSTYLFLCAVCIFGFALGGFSQSELQQLSFNFSAEQQTAIAQYALLKCLFYAIGIIALPKVLKKV